MLRRILLAIVWGVVFYFAGCALVGGIAGSIAAATRRPGEDAQAVGAMAGTRAVQTSRVLIASAAIVFSIVGSYIGLLPGTRVDRRQPTSRTTSRGMEQWVKTRELGRKRFIWLHGVMAWGLTAGVTWSIVMAMFRGGKEWPFLFLTAILGFPIGGYFVGASMWKRMEAKYGDSIATASGERQRPKT